MFAGAGTSNTCVALAPAWYARRYYDKVRETSVMKQQGNLPSVNYKSRANQKIDEELIIGQAINSLISSLKPKEQHEFYTSMRNYFITACDYIRFKFPLEDVALINAEVASKDRRLHVFQKCSFFFFCGEVFSHATAMGAGESY